MNGREYGDFLQDILVSINRIEDFLTGYEADDFIIDKRTVFAVLGCLHVLGEAAKHIPKQVRDNMIVPSLTVNYRIQFGFLS